MKSAIELLNNAKKYNNSNDLLKDIYGIDSKEIFDAFIIAPSWVPERIFKRTNAVIECISKHSYFSSYIINYEMKRFAWLQCGAGAGNLIDSLLCLNDTKVKKVIFVGAVGALKESINLGEIATPLESYAFEGGSLYLSNELNEKNFGAVVRPQNTIFINRVIKAAKENEITIESRRVFCTESIICEYSHLDFIKTTGAELIEMETASFYNCINLMNKDGIALLCVSDNSAAGISLVARTEEETRSFHNAREIYIPKLITIICEL